MMRLTVLGKYGPYPVRGGACSSYLVEEGDTAVLLDFGSGAYARLLEHKKLESLSAIALTHLHADHAGDIGILRYAVEQGQAKSPFCVLAPQGYPPLDAPAFRYVRIWDGAQTRLGSLTLTFLAVQHVGESYAIRVTDSNGSVLFYTGDAGLTPALCAHARGCNLLLADACWPSLDGRTPPYAHMTPAQAGQLARDAEAGRTLLTHVWGGGADEEQMLSCCALSTASVAAESETYVV